MINTTPLEGLAYDPKTANCYTLIQQFFSNFANTKLNDYIAPDRWWETQGLDLLSQNFRKEGFEAVDLNPSEYEIGDCFLMSYGTIVASHCGVYVGQGMFLHHRYGKLSCRELYKGAYRRTTIAVIRHKMAVFPKPEYKEVNLLDLLPKHVRESF